MYKMGKIIYVGDVGYDMQILAPDGSVVCYLTMPRQLALIHRPTEWFEKTAATLLEHLNREKK